MNGFNGAKIALLEARMSGELARLVQKHGGTVISAPALKETAVDCGPEVGALINQLVVGEIEIIVFQTGVGVSALLNEAEKLNRKEELIAALNRITTVCRGPKPTAVLGRNGIQVLIKVKEPHTTNDLVESLDALELKDKGVALLNYGERNVGLTDYLISRRAKLTELMLYEWQLPDDIMPLKSLITNVIAGEVDAVAFTSQIQVRHLFQIAEEMNQADELNQALQQQTIIASIGPTCTAALRALGLEPHVEPEHPKMGPMVQALLERFA